VPWMPSRETGPEGGTLAAPLAAVGCLESIMQNALAEQRRPLYPGCHLGREAFGVRHLPALSKRSQISMNGTLGISSFRSWENKAPGYGALQTLRAV